MLDGGGKVQKASNKHPLLFEMLRSYTTLAETLNLSHAVAQLDSTRQTVRRHIALLEEIRGGALFDVHQRQYVLTDFGRKELPGAIDLLLRAAAWTDGQFSTLDGLQRIHAQTDDGWFFHLQQQSLLDLPNADDAFMLDILQAWAAGCGRVDHPEFLPVRDRTLIFRRTENQWRFIEVGENSGYAKWAGLRAARSAIGLPMDQLVAGRSLETMVQSAYSPLEKTGSVRYDHIFTMFPHGADAADVPLAYERLLMAVRLSDDSPAIMSATRPSYELNIDGVSRNQLEAMPSEIAK